MDTHYTSDSMDGVEHTTIAQSPDIKIQHQGVLEGITGYLARLSAAGAVVTIIVCFACRTHMLLLWNRSHPVRLLLPLLKLFEFLLYLPHNICKVKMLSEIQKPLRFCVFETK